jgi:hypothetical protein
MAEDAMVQTDFVVEEKQSVNEKHESCDTESTISPLIEKNFNSVSSNAQTSPMTEMISKEHKSLQASFPSDKEL